MEFCGQVQALQRYGGATEHQCFIFLNSSTRGPFLPPYLRRGGGYSLQYAALVRR